jgi:hypothetical protein
MRIVVWLQRNASPADCRLMGIFLLNFQLYVHLFCHSDLLYIKGMGLGRVVRKVRQHPDDHEFESQRW